MKEMVLTDLAALCKKLADNSAITEEMRAKVRQFVTEYNSLTPFCGKGKHLQHFEAETLLDKMARFLPRVLEIKSYPESEPNEEALV